MKDGTLDRATFEAIESYVLHRMTAEERAAFEVRLAHEAGLRAELDLEREHIEAVELGGMSRLLKGIAKEESSGKGSGMRWSGILRYAAVVVTVAGVAIWWTARPPLQERLFAEHYVPDPGLPVAMGAVQDVVFADAMVAYKLGEFAEARTKWSKLLGSEPLNDTLRYYIASAWLAEKNTAQAVPMLEALAQESGSAFHAQARWYLFLAHVYDGQPARARALNMENDPDHGAQVRSILARLPD